MGYIDGIIAPVRAGVDAEAYRDYAARIDAVFVEHGATRVVDGWASDVPHGKVTDLYRAVAAEKGETLVFGWIEWPDKAARDAGWAKVMADQRLQPGAIEPPIDMKRMIFGGFTILVDQQGGQQ
jgi:uncharacterized protein YbaA (DUF1428 family)